MNACKNVKVQKKDISHCFICFVLPFGNIFVNFLQNKCQSYREVRKMKIQDSKSFGKAIIYHEMTYTKHDLLFAMYL